MSTSVVSFLKSANNAGSMIFFVLTDCPKLGQRPTVAMFMYDTFISQTYDELEVQAKSARLGARSIPVVSPTLFYLRTFKLESLFPALQTSFSHNMLSSQFLL